MFFGIRYLSKVYWITVLVTIVILPTNVNTWKLISTFMFNLAEHFSFEKVDLLIVS